jgi:hypothetical protein
VQPAAGELRRRWLIFLASRREDHVYWVERTARQQKNLTLNAAPVDVAEYLRRRLFESDTSVIMTSATLGTKVGAPVGQASADSETKSTPRKGRRPVLPDPRPLNYFIKRVGANPPCNCRWAPLSITSGR